MPYQDDRKRAYFLARIEEAEQLASKAADPETIESLKTIIDGYRALLKRVRETSPATQH